jgi:hypothetical protein
MFSFVSKDFLMRFLFLNLVFLMLGLVSRAQQLHFLYVQTDNKQSFYVKLKEKIYSSSSTGYLVIPKMAEGTYNLSVGFPKNEWPLQNLAVSIADKDLGFALKNFESKGWGLFNLQTLEVINASSVMVNQTARATEAKTDGFSSVLADVVNTPSIKEQEKSEPQKPAAVVKTEELKKEIDPAIMEKISTGMIERLSSKKDAGGIVLVYADTQAAGTDTIRVFIENDGENPEDAKLPGNAILETPLPVIKVIEPQEKPGDKKESPKFIEMEMGNSGIVEANPKVVESREHAAEAKNTTELPAGTASKMINSDCRQIATDEDFLKTRRKMSSEKTDESMVNAARKAFKQKCYSAEQVKNLSVLFLTDEGKYKLFDAAYPFVHDTPQFAELVSQLKDPYLITRFRAMLRN